MGVRWAKMVDDLSALKQAAVDGFEGVQLSVGRLVELSDQQVKDTVKLLKDLGLTVDACAGPLPQRVRVTEKGFNIYVWTEYLKGAVERVAAFGCRTLLWSDGHARVLPVEGDVSDMKQQMLQFVAMFCDVAASRSIRLLIEPLGAGRTNYLNTMNEIAAFIGTVNKSNLSSMISLRELSEIGVKEADLSPAIGLIGYVQADNPRAAGRARISPRPDDGYDYGPFFLSLRESGYGGTVALPDDSDAESLRFCRGLAGRN